MVMRRSTGREPMTAVDKAGASMRDVRQIINGFADCSLAIRSDGPPSYIGKDAQRIIVEGNSRGFRMLAETLLAMADAVENDPAVREHGWHLVLSPGDVPQLYMDAGSLLVLNCEPNAQDAILDEITDAKPED